MAPMALRDNLGYKIIPLKFIGLSIKSKWKFLPTAKKKKLFNIPFQPHFKRQRAICKQMIWSDKCYDQNLNSKRCFLLKLIPMHNIPNISLIFKRDNLKVTVHVCPNKRKTQHYFRILWTLKIWFELEYNKIRVNIHLWLGKVG